MIGQLVIGMGVLQAALLTSGCSEGPSAGRDAGVPAEADSSEARTVFETKRQQRAPREKPPYPESHVYYAQTAASKRDLEHRATASQVIRGIRRSRPNRA